MPHKMVVTVICDGHRPDFVSDEPTPNMARLRKAGTWFADHRGIFPSATRASSASIATGSWPISHGLRGNTMALAVDGGHEVHDAGKPEFYDAYRRHFGRLLLRPALAERAAAQHGAVLCSNVSPGAAYFHDAARHGELHHRELSYRPGGVPFGETVTYGELARRVGSPAAARAVGAACGSNPVPLIIPCHRAVGSDGSLTGFGGGLDAKRWLLAHERGLAHEAARTGLLAGVDGALPAVR
jgi:O-6-methylguanine DNA methyltransferase